MGCDIHCYIEYKVGTNDWNNFGNRINPGRNYQIFGRLAGVRDTEIGNPFPPRGLPDDNIGFSTRYDNTLYVSDIRRVGSCLRSDADNWVSRGYSSYVNEDKTMVTNPDWHTSSWLTADELTTCLSIFTDHENLTHNIEYLIIIDVLKSFENKGYKSRLVFWFDN